MDTPSSGKGDDLEPRRDGALGWAPRDWEAVIGKSKEGCKAEAQELLESVGHMSGGSVTSLSLKWQLEEFELDYERKHHKGESDEHEVWKLERKECLPFTGSAEELCGFLMYTYLGIALWFFRHIYLFYLS